MQEKDYYLPFSVFPGIGPKRFADLLASFHTPQAMWDAPMEALKKAGLGEVVSEKFELFRKTFSFEKYLKELQKAQVWFITPEETPYPRLLKAIPNPPFVLYGKGRMDALSSQPCVGIVGTRKITSYGRQVTEQFTRELVQATCCIVSGLAMGVDAIAHHITVIEKGVTIAVLGSGVDVCYPTSNQKIYDEIIRAGGCIVSEYPLHMPPSIGSFPSRNRIIAGLSKVLLVTEGAEDSGALITAKHMQELRKTVFAIPGPITSQLSKGTNLLIHQGARTALRPEDILGELDIAQPISSPRLGGAGRIADRVIGKTEEEQIVIDLLAMESLSLDELVRKTKLSVAQVSLLLSTLELHGVVKESSGTYTVHTGT